jgi:hypothetical protein
MRPYGVDISKWQGRQDLSEPHGVDFEKLVSMVAFLFVRAGYAGSSGTVNTDERVHAYMKDLGPILSGIKLPFSMYWYLRDDVSVVNQANLFSDIVNQYKQYINLPLIVDAEVFVQGDPESTEFIIQFQSLVEIKTGLMVDILYARAWQLNDETVPGLEEVLPHMFIARYDESLDEQVDEPWGNPGDDPRLKPRDYNFWAFWQFRSKGGGPEHGVQSASIDQVVYSGTQEELEFWAFGPEEPPIPEEPDMKNQVMKRLRDIYGSSKYVTLVVPENNYWTVRGYQVVTKGPHLERVVYRVKAGDNDFTLHKSTMRHKTWSSFLCDIPLYPGDKVQVKLVPQDEGAEHPETTSVDVRVFVEVV